MKWIAAAVVVAGALVAGAVLYADRPTPPSRDEVLVQRCQSIAADWGDHPAERRAWRDLMTEFHAGDAWVATARRRPTTAIPPQVQLFWMRPREGSGTTHATIHSKLPTPDLTEPSFQ
jgi:hypothetical protein